jgi:hypothetical protein
MNILFVNYCHSHQITSTSRFDDNFSSAELYGVSEQDHNMAVTRTRMQQVDDLLDFDAPMGGQALFD